MKIDILIIGSVILVIGIIIYGFVFTDRPESKNVDLLPNRNIDFSACENKDGRQGYECYGQIIESVLKSTSGIINTTSIDFERLCPNHLCIHSVGWAAAGLSGFDIPEAVRSCDGLFTPERAIHCYNGILLRLVLKEGIDVPTRLYEECTDAFDNFRCASGIGHGFPLLTNFDLLKSLENCDLLFPAEYVRSCWGGVFLEIMLSGPEPKTMDYCNLIPDKYRASCVRYSPWTLIERFGLSVSEVKTVCLENKDPYLLQQCLEGIEAYLNRP